MTTISRKKNLSKQPQQPSLFHFWGAGKRPLPSDASTKRKANNPHLLVGGGDNRTVHDLNPKKGVHKIIDAQSHTSTPCSSSLKSLSSKTSIPICKENRTRIVSPITNHAIAEKREAKSKNRKVHTYSATNQEERKCEPVSGEIEKTTVDDLNDDREPRKNDFSENKMDDTSGKSEAETDNGIEEGEEVQSPSTNDGGNDTYQKHGLSEYELLRLRNIERNNARLKALGLLPPNDETMLKRNRPQKPKRKRQKVKSAATETMPTRRSLRNRRPRTVENDFDAATIDSAYDDNTATIPTDVDEEQYEASPVFQYDMAKLSEKKPNTELSSELKCTTSATNEGVDFEISCLEPTGKRLIPPKGLGAIYAMQFYPFNFDDGMNNKRSWLVGAGKAGIVALWDCSKEEDNIASTEIDPILSWKAHSGRWIADASFLPGPVSTRTPSRLVTAANDGTICFWDLTTVSVQSGAPKLLHKTGKELHSSGIFAMDVLAATRGVSINGDKETIIETNAVMICTGSKDKTVALTSLSTIERNGAPLWRSYYHSGKISAVRFRGSSIPGDKTIGSASDDGLIAIHDCRIDGRSDPIAVLDNAHNKPHSIVWHPTEENVVMTAGLDETIKVWDIRFLNRPLIAYYGHVPVDVSRLKRIHHPVFYTPSKSRSSFVLTGSENSHSLSLFKHDCDTLNGDRNTVRSAVFSRGKLPEGYGDVGTIALHNEVVAASVDGGEILLMSCK